MRSRRLRVKPGVDPSHAAQWVTQLINDGRSVIASVGAGSLIGPGAVRLSEAYVLWVETVEDRLSALSFDLDLIEPLHTERYWRIRQLHEEPVRPVALVQAEIDRQTSWLLVLRDDLQSRIDSNGRAPGAPTVVGTNVLLEFVPPNQMGAGPLEGLMRVRG
jgi:hypothetical protein